MELGIAIGYLVALALPLWLVVEQVMHWQRSSKQPARRFESGKLSGRPASGGPVTATRPHVMRVAHQRKNA
jgi:hypothetical protein